MRQRFEFFVIGEHRPTVPQAHLVILSQPDKGAGEEQKRKVMVTGLFIARSDAAAPLDAVKETLDTVAYPVQALVVAAADFAGRAGPRRGAIEPGPD